MAGSLSGAEHAPLHHLQYRVENLEKWRDMIEREGIATTLALMEERQTVMSARMLAIENAVGPLAKASTASEGFWTRSKVILATAVALVALGGFALQIIAVLAGG